MLYVVNENSVVQNIHKAFKTVLLFLAIPCGSTHFQDTESPTLKDVRVEDRRLWVSQVILDG